MGNFLAGAYSRCQISVYLLCVTLFGADFKSNQIFLVSLFAAICSAVATFHVEWNILMKNRLDATKLRQRNTSQESLLLERGRALLSQGTAMHDQMVESVLSLLCEGNTLGQFLTRWENPDLNPSQLRSEWISLEKDRNSGDEKDAAQIEGDNRRKKKKAKNMLRRKILIEYDFLFFLIECLKIHFTFIFPQGVFQLALWRVK